MTDKISVEETLKSSDLNADLLPHLVYQEFISGATKRTVFKELVNLDYSLVGATGTKISVPYWASHFSANTITEDNLDSSGYSVTDPSPSDVDISIGNQAYVAFRLSDILLEDQPRIDWVRLTIKDAGVALSEYEDGVIRDVLIAGAGNSQTAATFGTLDDADITALLTKEKVDHFHPDDVVPYLVLHPDQEADLMADVTYSDTKRYKAGTILQDVNPPEEALYRGCRVRVTENMVQALGLIVFKTDRNGQPTNLHSYKRPLTVKTEREELYGRQLWASSLRFGDGVISANSVGLISSC